MACVTPFVPSFSSSPVVLNVNLRSLTNDRRSWISMTRFKLFLVLVRLSLVTRFLLFCFTLQSFLTLFSNLFLITYRTYHMSYHFSNNFEPQWKLFLELQKFIEISRQFRPIIYSRQFSFKNRKHSINFFNRILGKQRISEITSYSIDQIFYFRLIHSLKLQHSIDYFRILYNPITSLSPVSLQHFLLTLFYSFNLCQLPAAN